VVKCCGRSDLLSLPEGRMLFPSPPGRALQDQMTAEENRRVPLSTEVSPREAEVDPQLSACAQEGPPPGGLPETQPPGRRRRATGRAQAGVSSSTVRLAIGQLLGGRYRIECELAEGGWGWCTSPPMSRCPARGSPSRC